MIGLLHVKTYIVLSTGESNQEVAPVNLACRMKSLLLYLRWSDVSIKSATDAPVIKVKTSGSIAVPSDFTS